MGYGSPRLKGLAVDQQPMAVVFPRTVADVAGGHRDRPNDRGQGRDAGHRARGLGIWLDERHHPHPHHPSFQELAIGDGRARVGAGTLWGNVADAAGAAGLSGLGGSSPDVGVVGYTLGGGIGWLARRFGLASNAVRSMTWSPRTVASSAPATNISRSCSGPRGGGGGLGVVVGVEMDLFPG